MDCCKIGISLATKLEFPRLVSLGVDVSRDSLAICELYADGSQKFKEISNNTTSINRLVSRLRKIGYTGKVVMESTGRHHMFLAIALSIRSLPRSTPLPLFAK
jgi:hypothetical protein